MLMNIIPEKTLLESILEQLNAFLLEEISMTRLCKLLKVLQKKNMVMIYLNYDRGYLK